MTMSCAELTEARVLLCSLVEFDRVNCSPVSDQTMSEIAAMQNSCLKAMVI